MREQLGEILGPAKRLEPVGGPAVLVAALSARDLLVRDFADERMPERVFRLARDGAPALSLDELAPLEPMESRLRRLAVVSEAADPEHPPEDGRVLEQLLLVPVEDVEAGGDDALHGLGEAGALGALVEEAHELLRIQRVATGALEQRCLDIGGDGGALEQGVDELGRLLGRQRGGRKREGVRLATAPPRTTGE